MDNSPSPPAHAETKNVSWKEALLHFVVVVSSTHVFDVGGGGETDEGIGLVGPMQILRNFLK